MGFDTEFLGNYNKCGKKMIYMKIEFCLVDTGDIVFTKDSAELKDILDIITRAGTEVSLSFSKKDFIHGYVQNVMYRANAEDNYESLRIYFSRDFISSAPYERISPEHLSTMKLKERND